MVALENRGLALRLAVDSVRDTSTELIDVDIANESVFPLADAYHAWLEGVDTTPPTVTETAAPTRTGQDAITAIRNTIEGEIPNLGGNVNNLVADGIRQLSPYDSFDTVLASASRLINANEADLGARNAATLRRVVEGVR